MENSISNGVINELQPSLPSAVKPFNYKRNSVLLMVACVVGVILSVKFYLVSNYMANHPCSWYFGENCIDNGPDLNEIKNVTIQALYYGIVALIILTSSILLFFKKRAGLYLYLVGFCLILLSLFMSADILSFPNTITFFVGSLFWHSIYSAFMGGVVVGIGWWILIVIGVFVYFFCIIQDLIDLKKWKEFLGVKKTNFIFYIFLAILACLFLFNFFIGSNKINNNRSINTNSSSENYNSSSQNYEEPVRIDVPGIAR